MTTLFQAPSLNEVTIQPRPYQREALDALHNHICEKDSNPCVVIPTGGGKSLLMAWAIQVWKRDHPPLRVCILAHRKELVQQNAEEMQQLWPGGDIGIFAAGLKQKDQDTSVTFASIDSIYNKAGEFPPWDVLIVDEAHRIPAKNEGKYRTFIEGCKRFNAELRVIGFTATPYRMGVGSICHPDHVLHEVCYEADVGNLIQQGYLCKLRSKIGQVELDLSQVRRNSGGDYVAKSLSEAVDQDNVVAQAVRDAVKIILAENRKNVLFFCVDVQHAQDVSAELRKYGIEAPAVTQQTPAKVRDRICEGFKTGSYRAVCNVNVYTEGFNAKQVDCIVLLRPTLSTGLYVQMVGRGLRTHPAKEDCLVLDYANCIETHGPLDGVEEGEVRIITCENCGDVFSRAVRVCPHCGWEIPKQDQEPPEPSESEKKLHGDKAAQNSILSAEPDELNVDDVTVHRHQKPGKPDSVKVSYRCGLQKVNEWICLDHGGLAEKKARRWWRDRFGYVEARSVTVDSALADLFLAQKINQVTETITVRRKNKKFYEILDHKINNNPGWES